MTASSSSLYYKIEEVNDATSNPHQYYFISDLHLTPNRPELLDKFKAFINYHGLLNDTAHKTLYILGDLFDFWIGDDAAKALHHDIDINYLKSLTDAGLTVYVMHGNRDFLLANQFEQESGCQIIDDPSILTINQTTILLVHGDDLCTDDVSHQRFRRISRRYFPLLIKFIPISLRLKIAKKIRQKSKGNLQHKAMSVMDVNKLSLTRILEQHEPDLMIHGHTHHPLEETVQLKNKSVKRVVLNNW